MKGRNLTEGGKNGFTSTKHAGPNWQPSVVKECSVDKVRSMDAVHTLILEGFLIWSANLQTARLMICRVDKQIIRWLENWLNYQQWHKAPAGSLLPVLSLKDHYWGQYYWVFSLIIWMMGESGLPSGLGIIPVFWQGELLFRGKWTGWWNEIIEAPWISRQQNSDLRQNNPLLQRPWATCNSKKL